MIEGNSSKFGMIDLGGAPLVPDEIGAAVIKSGLELGHFLGKMPVAAAEGRSHAIQMSENCML